MTWRLLKLGVQEALERDGWHVSQVAIARYGLHGAYADLRLSRAGSLEVMVSLTSQPLAAGIAACSGDFKRQRSPCVTCKVVDLAAPGSVARLLDLCNEAGVSVALKPPL